MEIPKKYQVGILPFWELSLLLYVYFFNNCKILNKTHIWCYWQNRTHKSIEHNNNLHNWVYRANNKFILNLLALWTSSPVPVNKEAGEHFHPIKKQLFSGDCNFDWAGQEMWKCATYFMPWTTTTESPSLEEKCIKFSELWFKENTGCS